MLKEIHSSEGITTWSYTWQPPSCEDGREISVFYETFSSLATRQLSAVKLHLKSNHALDDVTIVDVLDGHSALRTTAVKTRSDPEAWEILSAVSPVGAEDTIAYILSTVDGDISGVLKSKTYISDFLTSNAGMPEMSSNASQADLASANQRYALKPGSKTAKVYKYIGIASSDHFGEQAESLASVLTQMGKAAGYDALRQEHTVEVGKLMHSNFVADFRDPMTGSLPEDSTVKALQITAISSAYYLYTNLHPFDSITDADQDTCIACNSLPVGGLVSQTYGGKIFWDADMFMAPAVQGTHPRLARQFALFRINRAQQAVQNTERHGLKEGSMLYPWTSGRYGQCFNISAPCVMYQYHLNADIALSLVMARNTSGDAAWFDEHGARNVVDGVAMGLGEILTYREEEGTWGIDVMTDADEYYMFVSDGSFSSSAISTTLEIASNLRREQGEPLEADWVHQTENMALPTSPDGDIVLEFRDMPNTILSKQADIILSHYPYHFQRLPPEKLRLAMDYYAVRQDPHGPAMTWSLYAIAANTLSTSGCAFWTFLVKSFRPYIRAPWYQYSEQQDDAPEGVKDPLTGNGIHPAFPFLTGHAGLLQTFTAGFLGLRVTERNLVILPSLPPQLEHFRPPVQFYNGAVVRFAMNRTHTTVTRLDAGLFDGLVPDRYGSADMPITIGQSLNDEEGYTFYLAINGTAVVANRMFDINVDIPGNILQCQPTTSPRDQGNVVFGATDGYAGTYWQPERSNETASLVVDISSQAPVMLQAVHLDFAMRPPRYVRVSVSNSSNFESAVELANDEIAVTAAWNPESPVVRYVGNITVIPLPSRAWSGQFAKLEVDGCWVEDGVGATVAEFALISADI